MNKHGYNDCCTSLNHKSNISRDLSCGHNISLKVEFPNGESYDYVFYSLIFLLFELLLTLRNLLMKLETWTMGPYPNLCTCGGGISLRMEMKFLSLSTISMSAVLLALVVAIPIFLFSRELSSSLSLHISPTHDKTSYASKACGR